jgi:hypothetical protein
MAKYMGQKFVSPSPDAEILGRILVAFIKNLHADEIAPILKKRGVSSFEPDKWYPMQLILDISKDMLDTDVHAPEKLVGIGLTAAEDFPFPPEVKTLQSAIQAVNAMLHQTMRNLPEGFGATVEVIEDKHLRVFSVDPFSTDSTYGFYWGTVNRFKNSTDIFVVRIIDNPDPENHPGTCFDIQWGATFDEIA